MRIRRTRRTDFTAVMGVRAASGTPVPPPDRITLRRFRQIVADLGGDFYVATVDDTLAGFVHVTYARQLARPPLAQLADLVVATPWRRQGVATALLAFVRRRARQRGCGTLVCVPGADAAARAFLEHAALRAAGDVFMETLEEDH